MREALEETNLKVVPVREVDRSFHEPSGLIISWFLCHPTDNAHPIPGDDIVEAKWVSKNNMEASCGPNSVAGCPDKVLELFKDIE